MRTTQLRPTCGFLALLVPAASWANAPAGYFFVGAFQLLVGNILLGIGEGWLIARILKISQPRAIGWMIAANYFSSWIGFLLPDVALYSPSLYEIEAYHWILVACFFALTVVLESPFVYGAIKSTERRARNALLACLLAQLASYGILVGVYYAGSHKSLFSHAVLDESLASWGNPNAVVYFQSHDGKVTYRRRLSAAGTERVSDADARKAGYEGCVRKDAWSTVDLSTASDPPWKVRNFYGRAVIARGKADEWLRLGLETPFLVLQVSHVTLIPRAQVVFQTENHSGKSLPPMYASRQQINLFDIASRKLSVIADGHCPFVVVVEAKAG